MFDFAANPAATPVLSQSKGLTRTVEVFFNNLLSPNPPPARSLQNVFVGTKMGTSSRTNRKYLIKHHLFYINSKL